MHAQPPVLPGDKRTHTFVSTDTGFGPLGLGLQKRDDGKIEVLKSIGQATMKGIMPTDVLFSFGREGAVKELIKATTTEAYVLSKMLAMARPWSLVVIRGDHTPPARTHALPTEKWACVLYESASRRTAQLVYDNLREHGIPTYMDECSGLPNQTRLATTAEGIHGAACVIPLITAAYTRCELCRQAASLVKLSPDAIAVLPVEVDLGVLRGSRYAQGGGWYVAAGVCVCVCTCV